jgi:hypothetical protein
MLRASWHRVNSIKAISISVLAGALSLLAFAGDSGFGPKFEEFKKEMLPQVGQKIFAIGTLRSGKLGYWFSYKDWGIDIYKTTTNSTDIAKFNALEKFHDHKVKVTGTLRYSQGHSSGSTMIAGVPEHFFFDAAEVVVSEADADTNEIPKSK